MEDRLTIFIGSSSKSKENARKVAAMLEDVEGVKIQVICWFADNVFKTAENVLDNIFKAIDNADGCVFILAEDDLTIPDLDTAKEQRLTTRDNVTIELGISYGRLGKGSTALCVFGKPHIPTDLSGIELIYHDLYKENKMAIKLGDWAKSLTKKDKAKTEKEKSPHYYKKMDIELYIHSNGNALLNFSSIIHINNKYDILPIAQQLDLFDAAKEFTKIPLQDMLAKKKDFNNREFGFWFRPEKGIIKTVKDYYWDDNDPLSNVENVNDRSKEKLIKWEIILDDEMIESGQDYPLDIAVSLPNMFPMSNGKFDKCRSYIKEIGQDKYYKQTFDWEFLACVDEFSLSVKFDSETALNVKNIEAKKNNIAFRHKKRSVNVSIDEKGAFEKIYTASIKNGQIGDTIKIDWDLDQY
jgi:hypothetical protein